MMLNLNLLKRKCFKKNQKNRSYLMNMLLVLMFHHINKITVVPYNHRFRIRHLKQDKDLFHLINEIAMTNPFTIIPALSPPTIVTFVTLPFINHTTKKISRALFVLLSRTQPLIFESPYAHPLHVQ